MRAVRLDQHGQLHCWKCRSSNFERKRTMRSKVIPRVGPRASTKTLKCLVCGAYNDVGHAKKIDVQEIPVPAPAPLETRSAADRREGLR